MNAFIPITRLVHKYLETALKVRGELKSEEPPPQGGLVLIGIKEAQTLTPGHAVGCSCDSCVEVWQERMRKSLIQSARRAAKFEQDELGQGPAFGGMAGRDRETSRDDTSSASDELDEDDLDGRNYDDS